MSLCAIAMPASGPAVPAASATSAAFASASARSGSTLMNALSDGSSAATRSSSARVSSTLDTRFARSAAPSATMVALIIEAERPRGRPKGALRGLRNTAPDTMHFGVGRHPRSQTRPSGLGFALLARASLVGQRT